MDDCGAGGEPLPYEAGGRSAQEHCAAGVGEKQRFLAAAHRASQRAGRGDIVLRVFSVSFLPNRRLYLGWSLKTHGDGNRELKKHCIWWCASCVCQYNWRDPNRVLSLQDGTDASEAKVFLADVPPKCRTVCKLVETTWWDAIFRSRLNSTNGLRKFIEMNKHQAGESWRCGGVQRGAQGGQAKVHKYDVPVREEIHELTL